jgi:hypothetical protein
LFINRYKKVKLEGNKLNEKQLSFFRALKDIKDTNVEISAINIHPQSKTKATEHLKKEYQILKTKLYTEEEIDAYRKIQNDIIETVIYEIMEMIDGYGSLEYPIDLIEKETNESLRKDIELHDYFMNCLYEIENDK